MLSEEALDEILKPVVEAMRAAARDIFSHGHNVGSQAAVQAILHNATALLPSVPSLISSGRPIDFAQSTAVETMLGVSMTDTAEAEVVRRAPKGLVDEVLEHVLREKPGMTQEQVEAAVVALDDRIAVKSVYNKLRAWEKQGRRFRRHRGLWYRIKDIPPPWAEQSSPEGETGGPESPGPFDNLDL